MNDGKYEIQIKRKNKTLKRKWYENLLSINSFSDGYWTEFYLFFHAFCSNGMNESEREKKLSQTMLYIWIKINVRMWTFCDWNFE